ncbi:MAG: T9SS type A sorting domain-containing protein [Bacteroidota bacterium]
MYSINQSAFSITETVGIDDQLKNRDVHLTIFPNPVTNAINVSFSVDKEWSSNNQIEIYNTTGQLVYTHTERINAFGSQILILELGKLPDGVYILKLVGASKNASNIFIKKTN